jgi:hypothetical protein
MDCKLVLLLSKEYFINMMIFMPHHTDFLFFYVMPQTYLMLEKCTIVKVVGTPRLKPVVILM